MTVQQPDPTRDADTGAAPGRYTMTELRAWQWLATIAVTMLAGACLLLAALVGGAAL